MTDFAENIRGWGSDDGDAQEEYERLLAAYKKALRERGAALEDGKRLLLRVAEISQQRDKAQELLECVRESRDVHMCERGKAQVLADSWQSAHETAIRERFLTQRELDRAVDALRLERALSDRLREERDAARAEPAEADDHVRHWIGVVEQRAGERDEARAVARDCAIIFKLLKKAYRALEQLEKELKDFRKSLPEEDAMRMRLLSLEGMCRIALIKKRGASELLKVLLGKIENDVLEVSNTDCYICGLESSLCECWNDHYTSE